MMVALALVAVVEEEEVTFEGGKRMVLTISKYIFATVITALYF